MHVVTCVYTQVEDSEGALLGALLARRRWYREEGPLEGPRLCLEAELTLSFSSNPNLQQ